MKTLMLAVATAAVVSAGAATDVKVEFWRDDVVRILKIPEGGKSPEKSYVVTAKPEKVAVAKSEKDGATTYVSAKLRVTVDAEGRVAFAAADGTPLLAEEGTTFTPRGLLDGDEPVYGLGIVQEDSISRRGITKKVLQDNIEDYSPVFQSIKGWGVFIDSASIAEYKELNGVMSYTSEVGDASDYYFMYGGSSDGVVRQIRWLSGEVPLQPKWSLGYYVSRERYTSWAQLAEIVDEHRKRGIPMDCIVQDWQYWGAKLMISFWPDFGPNAKPNKDFRARGWYFKDFVTWPRDEGVIVYDAFNPAARDLYWNVSLTAESTRGGWTPPSRTTGRTRRRASTRRLSSAATAACATSSRS